MLGATHGSATNQLRKSIMFDMAGKLGLLSCYRCQKPITCVGEFSIDHKEVWEGAENPAKNFFSLENIAFSHMSCNSLAARKNRKYATKEDAKAAERATARKPEVVARRNEARRLRRQEAKLEKSPNQPGI